MSPIPQNSKTTLLKVEFYNWKPSGSYNINSSTSYEGHYHSFSPTIRILETKMLTI